MGSFNKEFDEILRISGDVLDDTQEQENYTAGIDGFLNKVIYHNQQQTRLINGLAKMLREMSTTIASIDVSIGLMSSGDKND